MIRGSYLLLAATALAVIAVAAGCGNKGEEGATSSQPGPRAAAGKPAATAANAVAGTGAAEEPQSKLTVGMPVPDFSFADVNGKTLTRADYAGKVLVVDFWATTCDSCTKKLVKYQPLWEKHRAEGMAIFVVASDDRPETVKGWLKLSHPELTMPSTMKSQTTDGAFWGGPAQYTIPVAKVFDRKGVLRYELGPESTYDELEAAVLKLLAEKPTA